MRVIIRLCSERGGSDISKVTLTNITDIKHDRTGDILTFLHRSKVMSSLYFPDITSIEIEQDKKEDAKP